MRFLFILRLNIALLILSLGHATLAQNAEPVFQVGHAAPVTSILLSNDGKLLFSGSRDGTITVWDVSTGAVLRHFTMSGSLSFIAISSDSSLIAGAGGGKVTFWKVLTGEKVLDKDIPQTKWKQLREEGAKSSTGRSPDQATTAEIIEAINDTFDVTDRLVADTRVETVSFSHDGQRLVSAGDDIHIFDISSGKRTPLATDFNDFRSYIRATAFSSDDAQLIGTNGHKTGIWNVSDGKLRSSFESDTSEAAAFSPGAKLLAGSGKGNIIKVWDVASGAVLQTFAEHASQIKSLTWVADGSLLFSGDTQGVVKVWNMSSVKALRTFKLSKNIRSIAADLPNDEVAIVGEDSAIKLLQFSSGQEVNTYNRPFSRITSLVFSPDGKMMASGDENGVIQLWDISTGIVERILHGHPEQQTSIDLLVFSSDNRTLTSLVTGPKSISTLEGQTLNVDKWDVTTGVLLKTQTLPTRGKGYELSALSPHGDILANLTTEGIEIYDIAKSSMPRKIELKKEASSDFFLGAKDQHIPIRRILFSSDGNTLLGEGESVLLFWDVDSGKENRVKRQESSGELRARYFRPESFGGGTEALSARRIVVKAETIGFALYDATNRILARVITVDQKNVLVFTSDGLFDGPPEAWSLLRWRYSPTLYDTAPIESYFNEFFYPGLLTDFFAGKRPKAPSEISQKDRRQPRVKLTLADIKPEATITTRGVKLKISISEATADKEHRVGSGAEDVRLFRNGSLVKVWHGDVLKGKSNVTLEATIPLVAGENRLTAYAFNHDNIKSSDATLVVNGADSLKRAGTLYVLGIGSNEYKSKGYDLKFALADVDEISQQVKAYQDKLGIYAHTEIITLENQEATKANIMLALGRFGNGSQPTSPANASPSLREQLDEIKQLEPEDALVIYYAGHGTAIGDHFYLLPNDFVAGNEEELKASSISDIELNEVLERVDAGKMLMVIDACQSGQALGGEKEGRGPMNSKGVAQLAYDKGMYILTASQSYQAAQEVSRTQAGEKIEHGLLTFALLEGLNKAKKDNEGRISEREWMNYAVEQVPLLQTEAMVKRELENKGQQGPGHRGTLVVVEGDKEVDPEKRNVQRPRVFYHRELEAHPLIIAMQY